MTWEYVPDVAASLIDRQLSLQNQARLGVSLNPDLVDEYAIAMLEGAVFPALVAFPLQNGTYLRRIESCSKREIGHVNAALSHRLPSFAPRHQIQQGPQRIEKKRGRH